MGKTASLILLLIIIIFSVAVGVYSASFYYKNNCKANIQSLAQQRDVITDQQKQQLDVYNSLKSSLVNNITIFGQVKSASAIDNSIVLSFNGDDISLAINNSTKIYSTANKSTQNNPLSFSDIKTGQNLYIYAKISSDNKLTASYIKITK